MYEESGRLAAANRWPEACLKLEASLQLDPGVGTLLRLGSCYERVGRTASAWSSFNDAAALATKADDKRAAVATEAAQRLEPTLARLSIALDARAAGVAVRRDGTAIGAGALGTPVPVDPGTHTVEATQPGKQAWKTTVSIAPGPGVTTVQVPALQDAPQAAVPTAPGAATFWTTQRVAGASIGAVGAAGTLIGAILGGVTLAKASSLKTGGQCNASLTVCTSTGLPLEQSAATVGNAATGMLAVGGAALVAGVVVFATGSPRSAGAPKRDARVIVGPVAGAGLTGVLVSGRW